MAVALPDLPRFLVIDPMSTVRVEIRLAAPACEIDVELENPRPGRSFVLLIGHKGGPYVQRVRLAGKARIYFDPESPGEYVLLVANPQKEPIVLRLRARDIAVAVPHAAGKTSRALPPSSGKGRASRPRRGHRTVPRRTRSSANRERRRKGES